jgi:hypothetical protein
MGCCDGQTSDTYDVYDYVAPVLRESKYGFKAMEDTLPFDDGVKRDFQRPFFHDDGSIEYPVRGDEPGIPPDINGYKRDPDNLHLFHPQWNDCQYRLQGTHIIGGCGAIEVVMVCQHGQSQRYLKELQTKHCEMCRFRQPNQDNTG